MRSRSWRRSASPAGSYSTGNNVTGGGLRADGSQFLWYSYQAGGCGARPWADGNTAEWHLMANSRNESMEVWETRYPVEFLSFSLLPDSGGPGRYRGGLGTERRVRITEPTRLSGISDHHRIGAVGLQGGHAGLPNGFAIERDGKRAPLDELFGLASPSKFANLPVRAGDVFVSIQGGGGGFGDPKERPRDRVRADVEAGYVSPEQAASYGYEAANERAPSSRRPGRPGPEARPRRLRPPPPARALAGRRARRRQHRRQLRGGLGVLDRRRRRAQRGASASCRT